MRKRGESIGDMGDRIIRRDCSGLIQLGHVEIQANIWTDHDRRAAGIDLAGQSTGSHRYFGDDVAEFIFGKGLSASGIGDVGVVFGADHTERGRVGEDVSGEGCAGGFLYAVA